MPNWGGDPDKTFDVHLEDSKKSYDIYLTHMLFEQSGIEKKQEVRTISVPKTCYFTFSLQDSTRKNNDNFRQVKCGFWDVCVLFIAELLQISAQEKHDVNVWAVYVMILLISSVTVVLLLIIYAYLECTKAKLFKSR